MITHENFKKDIHTEVHKTTTSYNLSMLEEMDDTEYLIEVVSLFLEDTPDELKKMKAAVGTGDTTAIAKTAHKLKSSAGVLQAGKFSAILNIVETAAKTGASGNELAGHVETAICEYKNIELALKKHLAEIS